MVVKAVRKAGKTNQQVRAETTRQEAIDARRVADDAKLRADRTAAELQSCQTAKRGRARHEATQAAAAYEKREKKATEAEQIASKREQDYRDEEARLEATNTTTADDSAITAAAADPPAPITTALPNGPVDVTPHVLLSPSDNFHQVRFL